MRLALLALVLVATGCAATRERSDTSDAGVEPDLTVFRERGGQYSVAYPTGWEVSQPSDGSLNGCAPELQDGCFGGFAGIDVESYAQPWTAADRAFAADSNARAEGEDKAAPTTTKVVSFGPARLGSLPAYRLVVTGEWRDREGAGPGRWHVTTYVADVPGEPSQFVFECGDASHDPSLCDRLAATFRPGPPESSPD